MRETEGHYGKSHANARGYGKKNWKKDDGSSSDKSKSKKVDDRKAAWKTRLEARAKNVSLHTVRCGVMDIAFNLHDSTFDGQQLQVCLRTFCLERPLKRPPGPASSRYDYGAAAGSSPNSGLNTSPSPKATASEK